MMATLDFINDPVRSANTNHVDRRKERMHIAAYGCVFLVPGAARAAQVVPATPGWTVPVVVPLKKNN